MELQLFTFSKYNGAMKWMLEQQVKEKAEQSQMYGLEAGELLLEEQMVVSSLLPPPPLDPSASQFLLSRVLHLGEYAWSQYYWNLPPFLANLWRFSVLSCPTGSRSPRTSSTICVEDGFPGLSGSLSCIIRGLTSSSSGGGGVCSTIC